MRRRLIGGMLWVVGTVISGALSGVSSASGVASADAVSALAQRVLGPRAQDFEFGTIPNDAGCDVFEIESGQGRIVIRGSSPVAMASGLNWYLKYHCHASVSWCGNQLDLPIPLPAVDKLRMVSPHRYRYCFNYCTFSYTMAWWDWDRWEREIDWMALNGINMPLSVTGQEAIWQTVCRNLGLSDEAVNAFFVGPAYLPFGWMGCMDAWGGPLSQTWIDKHCELEKRIVARERELGMTPALQGFTGHVPAGLKTRFPEANLRQTSSWCGFPPTYFVDPADPLFIRIGKAFVEEQTRQYGTDHLYASDTFIEMTPPSNDPAFLASMGRAVYEAMAAADPSAVWVMQGWIFVNNPKFWQPPQAKALLGAVPDDHMILLDLFCETKPVWKETEAFYGKPWIWCIVHDFGGTLGMQGNLLVIAQGPPSAMRSPQRGRMSGIGLMMEGIEQNPVVYDLMTEMTWRNDPPNLTEWIRDYAHRRYGRSHPKTEQAWQTLLDTVYRAGGSPVPPICARPALASGICANPPYDPQRLVTVWQSLLECADELGRLDTYQYDLVNVARQVLADLSSPYCRRMLDAYRQKDRPQFEASAQRFLDLIRDLDSLLATRQEFLLGRWIAAAKRWGATEEETRHCEWNARNQITLWGPRFSVLHEYAYKQWSDLVAGFYFPRWKRFTERLSAALDGTPFDAEAFNKDITAWEETWTHQTEPYPAQPQGDPVAVARALFAKYGSSIVDQSAPSAPVSLRVSPSRARRRCLNTPRAWPTTAARMTPTNTGPPTCQRTRNLGGRSTWNRRPQLAAWSSSATTATNVTTALPWTRLWTVNTGNRSRIAETTRSLPHRKVMRAASNPDPCGTSV